MVGQTEKTVPEKKEVGDGRGCGRPANSGNPVGGSQLGIFQAGGLEYFLEERMLQQRLERWTRRSKKENGAGGRLGKSVG